ncbi:MAG: hypothetical protein P4M05_14435 [Bradyrhizobium sp.]|nr:hypothetical protein [Bradyrhizobium sp.]
MSKFDRVSTIDRSGVTALIEIKNLRFRDQGDCDFPARLGNKQDPEITNQAARAARSLTQSRDVERCAAG